MNRVSLVFLALLLFSFTFDLNAASYQDFIVMVESHDAQGGEIDLGAGIVVDETDQRTTIVTALHVLRTRSGNPVSDIRVEFRTLRGKVYPATTTSYYANRSLDLAVIFVERKSTAEPPRVITAATRTAISPSAPSSLVGSDVQVVGAMGRERWTAGVKKDRVISGKQDELEIHSDEARAGASGGGVFDSFGRLVGMATRVQPPTQLVTLPIDAIALQLERWGIPLGIVKAEVGSSSPELLVELRNQLHIDVEFKRPNSISNGLEDHRVVARLSKSLSDLRPTIEVIYAPYVPEQITKLELVAPSYSADVRVDLTRIDGSAWAVFPDGRRLGPIPIILDFESGPVEYLTALGEEGKSRLSSMRNNGSTERQNAVADEIRMREVKEKSAKKTRQDLLEDRRFESEIDSLKRRFPWWSIHCMFRLQAWECWGPPFSESDLELFFSLKIGTNPDDLQTEIPKTGWHEFNIYFGDLFAKLLSSSESVDAIYVRGQLVTGEVLGPTQLCHVRRKKSIPVSCNE